MKKVDMNTVDNEKTENVDVEVNDTNEVEASENQEPKDEQQQETAENAETAETEQQDPLEAAKAEIEELKKQALYKQAEFENFRKRTLKEKADLILAGGEKAITAILPVLDDFERALADKSDDANAIREGMELIFQKFQKTLESLGVKKIETEGADFNVDYHESVALVPGMGEDKKGKVIDCVQTGYTLNDKVIRFAKVAVGQ
ncbi:MAG: nucleotide exchange factor GrpE [Prevotella sp.]|jgi:molecular chaperone GrpE|nr:nucleotide exchange factor GrpE [Prevotella sp.]